MEYTEDINLVKDILQNIMKAKKTLKMYPSNNPIYMKMLEDSYAKFVDFFNHKNDLSLKIGQKSIFYDSEEIYHKPEKEDNLALFFFKDGLRELTFKKGLLQEELEEFLKIITSDFEREAVDEDVVTLLWEKDFQNIMYLVDDSAFLDEEGADYEHKAISDAKQGISDIEGLRKAYVEEFTEDEVKETPIISFTDKDLRTLMGELEIDSANKIEKLTDILFEILYQSEEMKGVLEDILRFLKDTIKLSMSQGDIKMVIQLIARVKEVIDDPSSTEDMKKYMRMLLIYLGSDEVISILGELLDSGIRIEEETFQKFIRLLDKRAIMPLVNVLGELKTFRVREKVIDALVLLGRQDLKTLASALGDDRWYIVRNVIHILRKIGDKGAKEYLLKTIRHGDVRVRREVIRGLGELGGEEALQPLKERLDDTDTGVRIEAAKAIGNIGSERAKRIILEKISERSFNERDFEEKKDFYRALANWKTDPEVFDFLIKSLKKGSFLWWARNFQDRACAALCLGLTGNKDALPYLSEQRDSGNRLLDEYIQSAMKRIEHAS
jgi:hypothetical protein